MSRAVLTFILPRPNRPGVRHYLTFQSPSDIQQARGGSAVANELETPGQTVCTQATWNRDRRMPGDVEQLREPQHDRPDGFGAIVDRDRLRPDFRRTNRERRQDECIETLERPIHCPPKHRPRVHRAEVVLREDVPSHSSRSLTPGEYLSACDCRNGAWYQEASGSTMWR